MRPDMPRAGTVPQGGPFVQGQAAEQDAGARPGPEDSLHTRIATVLRTEIALGQHPVGSFLPTEAALRARFGVSRHTVREALRTLSDLGLIDRKQGSGTRVVARSGPVGYVHRLHTLAQIFQFTEETELDIRDVAVVAAASPDVEVIPARPGSRWLLVTGVRRTAGNGLDVSAARIFVHLRFADALSDLRQRSGPIFATIEEKTGETVTEAQQEITGGPIPAAAAAALGLKPRTPGICVVRRYLDVSGTPMLTAINWHQADRFTFAMTLRRDSPG